MEMITKSFCMQGLAEEDLRFRILATDPGRHAATNIRRNNVSQWKCTRRLMKIPFCISDI